MQRVLSSVISSPSPAFLLFLCLGWGREDQGPPDHPSPQVDYVEPSQNTISLKMIPRIDYDRIKARMSLVPGGHPVARGWGRCLIFAGGQAFLLHPSQPCPLSSTERLVCQKEEV